MLPQVGYSTPTIGEVSSVDGGLPKFFWADSQYESDEFAFSDDIDIMLLQNSSVEWCYCCHVYLASVYCRGRHEMSLQLIF